MWVTQPRHQLRRLGNKRFYQASGEAQNPCCLYKGIRTPFRTHAFFFPIHSPSLELQRPSVHLLCPQRLSENVRIRSRRPSTCLQLRTCSECFCGERCELGRWSSSAREWMSREEEGVGKEEESLSLYKGGRNCAPPHLRGKLAYSPSAVINGAVGLPTPVLMRIP